MILTRLKNCWRRRSQSDEGAVLVLVAVSMTVLIGSTAMSVDLGRLAALHRTLQAEADVISLDAGRYLDGVSPASTQWAPVCAAAVDSATRNNYSNLSSVGQCGGQVVLGHYSGYTFTPQCSANCSTDGTDIPNAVQIVPFGTLKFLFVPGSTTTSRKAAAIAPPAFGFTVGSYLASYRANSTIAAGVLDAMLKTTATGTLVGYGGLATSNVTLSTLASPALVAQIFNGGATLRQILDAEVAYLGGPGTVAGGSLSTTESLTPNLDVALPNILGLSPGVPISAASQASVNPLELLSTTAEVHAKVVGSPIDLGVILPLLQATITGLAPPTAVGPGQVGESGSTAQVTVTLTLAGLPTTVSGVTATGTLTGLDCAGNTATVGVTTSPLLVNGVSSGLGGTGSATFTPQSGSQTVTNVAPAGALSISIGALTPAQIGALLASLNIAVLGADVTSFGPPCGVPAGSTPLLAQ